MLNCAYLRTENQARLRTYGIQIATQPTLEQITLEQARLHLRLDSYGSPPETADDQWILDTIPAAREWCEFYSGRSLAPQVIDLILPRFPHAWFDQSWDHIPLPMGPIAGVESITYLDDTGVSTVADLTTYVVDVSSDIGYVYPVINTSWPTTQARPNAVRIRYHAGYTTVGESPNDMPLPKRFRSAMLLVLGHLYENRENTTELSLDMLPLGAQSLMDGMRLRLGMA